MSAAAAPDLSIVVEMTAGDIVGACDARRNLASWAAYAASAVPSAELLAVAPVPVRGLDTLDTRVETRAIHVPDAGYYSLKNAGANAARGAIVFFTDADCRPDPGSLAALVRSFDDPEVACVAGRSLYDGPSLLTRINSAHSFGDLHCGQAHFDQGRMAVAHNVAARRSSLPRDPFGPFVARVGGDRYLTDAMRRAGHRIQVIEDLLVFHEDPTYSLRGTIERHLRDCFVPLGYGTARQRVSVPFTLACTFALRPALRLARLARSGARVGLRPIHYPVALALNLAYWALDLCCVGGVLLVPSLRRRWLRFHFGPSAA